jgi:hypothetical protein
LKRRKNGFLDDRNWCYACGSKRLDERRLDVCWENTQGKQGRWETGKNPKSILLFYFPFSYEKKRKGGVVYFPPRAGNCGQEWISVFPRKDGELCLR